jgi:hypothetical protein
LDNYRVIVEFDEELSVGGRSYGHEQNILMVWRKCPKML